MFLNSDVNTLTFGHPFPSLNGVRSRAPNISAPTAKASTRHVLPTCLGRDAVTRSVHVAYLLFKAASSNDLLLTACAQVILVKFPFTPKNEPVSRTTMLASGMRHPVGEKWKSRAESESVSLYVKHSLVEEFLKRPSYRQRELKFRFGSSSSFISASASQKNVKCSVGI